MRIVARVLVAVVGLAFGVVGFFFWMLSNDLGAEPVMKLLGAVLMLVAIVALGFALFGSDSNRIPGADNSERIQ